MSRTQRKALAYHEAAHAVIGRIMGQLCGHSTIIADEDCAGATIFRDQWQTIDAWKARGRWREEDSIMRGRIISTMAGAIAEVVLLHLDPRGDGDDQYRVTCMLDDLCVPVDRLEAHKARLYRFAVAAVKRHRASIEIVARALLKAKVLSGEDISVLIGHVGLSEKRTKTNRTRGGRFTMIVPKLDNRW